MLTLFAYLLAYMLAPISDGEPFPLRALPYVYEQTPRSYIVRPIIDPVFGPGFECDDRVEYETPSIRFLDDYRALGGVVYDDGSCNMRVFWSGDPAVMN